MLKIRLQRVGRRNNPAFRVVVTESTRGPKSNNNVELLGSYSPHTDSATLNNERIQHWVSKGAQVSDTVHNILVNEKIIDDKKKNVLPRKSPVVKEDITEGVVEKESSEVTTPDAENKETAPTAGEQEKEQTADADESKSEDEAADSKEEKKES